MTASVKRACQLFTTLVFALGLLSPAANAEMLGSIAAVVNEEAVTASDLDSRLSLGLLASGLPDTTDARDRLRAQVLRTLIDERIRLQEATRLGIEPTDNAIAEGVSTIATQNNIGVDAMITLFAQSGIPLATLQDQVRSTLAWNELVSRRLGSGIQISESDIDEVIARIEGNRGSSEFLLAEIVLPVADRQSEAEVSTFANEIVSQIRGGASFAAIARQFSAAAGADSGGDLGWVLEGGFSPEVEQALANLSAGQLSEPIRTVTGYSIYLVRQKRRVLAGNPADTTVTLRRLAVPFAPGITADKRQELTREAEEFRASVNGCQTLREQNEILEIGEIEDMGSGKVSDLGARIRDEVADLPIGTPSAMDEFPTGVVFYMVCDRDVPGANLPERNDIARDLTNEQLDRLQRRYLRDLRNAAYIEVRG